MSGGALIEARGVKKRFRLYHSPRDRLVEWATFGRNVRHQDHWALRGVDVRVERGECVGIIGRNGSGKSTLLKTLCGVLHATEGSIERNGRIHALLDLRAGFNRHVDGRRNIELAGHMLGLDPNYVRKKTDAIIDFADLGPFIDQPMRVYSPGMLARLGFSLFAFLEPDVLMIDEVLAVGDLAFKNKCFDLIEQRAQRESGAIMLVSHALGTVASICTRVIWIDGGEIRQQGDPTTVVNAFADHFSAAGTNVRPQAKGVREGADEDALPMASMESAIPPDSGLLHSDRTGAIAGIWLENQFGDQMAAARAQKGFTLCVHHRRGAGRLEVSISGPGGGSLGLARAECDDARDAIVRLATRSGLPAGQFDIEIRSEDGRVLAQCRLPVVGGVNGAGAPELFHEPVVIPVGNGGKAPD